MSNSCNHILFPFEIYKVIFIKYYIWNESKICCLNLQFLSQLHQGQHHQRLCKGHYHQAQVTPKTHTYTHNSVSHISTKASSFRLQTIHTCIYLFYRSSRTSHQFLSNSSWACKCNFPYLCSMNREQSVKNVHMKPFQWWKITW